MEKRPLASRPGSRQRGKKIISSPTRKKRGEDHLSKAEMKPTAAPTAGKELHHQ